jgi:hypothetical protein
MISFAMYWRIVFADTPSSPAASMMVKYVWPLKIIIQPPYGNDDKHGCNDPDGSHLSNRSEIVKGLFGNQVTEKPTGRCSVMCDQGP